MPFLRDDLLSSSREVLDYFLQDPWFRTHSVFDANRVGRGGMVFRGQSDAAWPLRPSAFRAGRLRDFTAQPPPEQIDAKNLKRHLGFQLHAEVRAVHLFLEHADSLGIPTPLDYTTTQHGIDLVLAALNGKEFDYSTIFPPESFERATALAQHHGVPTRLLDWSESPLVACYFAAFGASCFAPTPPTENQEIAIAYMSSNSLFESDGPTRIVRAPRHENTYLRQQQGLFSSFRNANEYFLAHGDWPALDDLSSPRFQVHRVRLPATQADSMLRELFDLDITRQSLQPSLDAAAKALEYAKRLFEKDA